MATDVEETSEAEVHEISAENGPDEGDNSATEAAAQDAPVDEFERSAAAARESLIAELQRTVESVSTRGRRRHRQDPLRRPRPRRAARPRRPAPASRRSSATVSRSCASLPTSCSSARTWLSNQIAELTSQAETHRRGDPRRGWSRQARLTGAAGARVRARGSSLEREAEQRNEADAEGSADDDKQGAFGLFRRRRPADVS